VELFASLFQQRRLDWILAHFNDGATLPGYQQLADVGGVSAGLRAG
jgi:hypothetical protein